MAVAKTLDGACHCGAIGVAAFGHETATNLVCSRFVRHNPYLPAPPAYTSPTTFKYPMAT